VYVYVHNNIYKSSKAKKDLHFGMEGILTITQPFFFLHKSEYACAFDVHTMVLYIIAHRITIS
jgi:hypothetical protein